MMRFANLYPFQRKYAAFEVIKRLAGHSKWQNIRHIKAAKDSEKALTTMFLLKNIRKAVLANGGIADPSKNLELESCITAAYKANVSRETVANFLLKLQTSKETVMEYQLRGPKDCILIITYSCIPAAISHIRENVKKILRGQSCLRVTDGFLHVFDKKGIILAKHSSKTTMDDAEEAAILAEAEDVAPEEGDENIFKFGTESGSLWQVVKALKEDGWEILQSSVELIPQKTVDLSESEAEDVFTVLSKLQEFPEYLRVVHNIQ